MPIGRDALAVSLPPLGRFGVVTLSAVVADDEPLGRRGIVARLARAKEFEVVAECRSGRETIDAVRRHRPDVLFLDVQMPGIDGFQVVDALSLPESDRPYVIFVTAFDRHAVRAFEVQALDYLVKPIEDARFEEALRRASDAIARRRESEVGRRVAAVVASAGEPAAGRSESREGPLGASFAVRDHGRVTFVRHAEVDWIESAGDYVRLHGGTKSWLMRETLTSVARRLPEKRFLRIHRRAIVQVDRIRELRAFDSGDYAVLLRDGTELRLSRTFHDAVARLTSAR
ncbi:MAG: LytTR family DNA-binding domain-containing protein [Acidobacteriota bacterium]